jgi:hypothetical protein
MGRFTIRLEARHPARDVWRAYALEAGRDLFGAWVVEVSYGRIGCPGRTLVRVLETEAEARRIVRRCLKRRVGAPRRIGVAYELRRLTDPKGWSAGLIAAASEAA